MASPPKRPIKKGLAALIALLVIIAAVIVTATFVLDRESPTPKASDTAADEKLSSGRDGEAAKTVLLSKKSIFYSPSIYDIEIGADFKGTLPWASEVAQSPGGAYSFTWRIKLTAAAAFSVKIHKAAIGPYSIELSDTSGAPVFIKSHKITIPTSGVELAPGIYVLKAGSKEPLDLFEIELKTHGERTTDPFKLKSLNIEIDAASMKSFEKMVDISLDSTKSDILKMAGGRVAASITDTAGRRLAGVRMGLSGRSREHLGWFPSVDLKLDGGSFLGIESFKLYRLKTKSGLLDLTFLSLYKDMGFMVPRQDVVRLFVNKEYQGLYILMETPGGAMFMTQRAKKANIIGVNTKKVFFDYPYGATLKAKNFSRLKEKTPVAERFFLSDDLTASIDTDRFARFIAFASIYYAAHGLGVDVLRFYEDPVTGLWSPLPRDLNPGIWPDYIVGPYASYLTHLGWLQAPPLYTVWPFKRPLRHDYTFDRSKNLFQDAYKVPFATGTADIHFTIANFIKESSNLELTNRYLTHFSANRAMIKLTEARIRSTLKSVLAEEPSNALLGAQLLDVEERGVSFFGPVLKKSLSGSATYLQESGNTFIWNLRTSTTLAPDLMPSLLAPMRYDLDEAGWRAQVALNFTGERKIFSILEEAGVKLAKRSFKRTGARKGALSLSPRAYKSSKDVKIPDAPPALNVATYLGTHLLTKNTALLVLLVRNATKEVTDYKVVMRDGSASYAPVVNTAFRLDRAAKNSMPSSTPLQIALRHMTEGEGLRLLAFKLPLGTEAAFYSVAMPENSWFTFPPYMYLPAGASVKRAPGGKLPDGIQRGSGGYLIAEGALVEVTGDVVIPKGAPLRIEAGAAITMHPGSSITVNGDLIIRGTKKRRVKFTSPNGRPWGGIYAGGSSSGAIKVELINVDFADYGEFPKTKIGDRRLSGAITLYRANARIEGVRITGAKGEDAINLVDSTASIRDTDITAPFSDAIDLDFSTASIDGLRVDGALGDGLDLSVSLVDIKRSDFSGIGDKGISVGEMSTIYVKSSSFTDNKIAIANKDQSHLELSGSSFKDNKVAVAEFIKKPYFARPTSVILKNSYSGNVEDYSWIGSRP